MKTNSWFRVGAAILACAATWTFAAEDAKPKAGEAADAAWQEVQKALRPPPPPAEWRTKEPTEAQITEYERRNGVLAGEAADKAKAFYTKYPEHKNASEARSLEVKLLQVAVQLGNTNRQVQLDAAFEQRLKDPSVSEDERFNLRAQRVVRLLMDENAKDPAENLQRAEVAARDLHKEFPKRDEVSELMLMVAQGYSGIDNVAKARLLTEEVLKNASGDAKEQAQAQLRKLNMLGKPLELSFKSLEGKQISMKDYAGKVVLVDFWATWCAPCRAALPEVKSVYNKFHDKGFEILGISFDKDKEALTSFIKEENLKWPQYFDGLGWDNKLGQKFEISSIPTVWLVDKQGKLRHLNAGEDLAEKVEKLLAEK